MQMNPCRCGAEPEVLRVGDREQFFAVVCTVCGTRKPYVAAMTPRGAITQWNRIHPNRRMRYDASRSKGYVRVLQRSCR